jgi:hypothetical protein
VSQARIKGQESEIVIVRGGTAEDSLTDIHAFNMEFESEVLSRGYLGEKTDRKDDVYKGVKFDFEMHSHSQDWLRFIVAIHDRQKRNTPNLIINIGTVLFYANGDEPQFYLPDCKFGPQSVTNASRTDYIGKKIGGECDDYNVAFS